MIKISVIIPVFNVEPYLVQALDSLRSQNFDECEFICIDDGSTDSSLEICRKYSDMDSRFIVISEKNGGPAKARNHGLDVARGEFICFMDPDDYFEPNALEIMYNNSEGVDILVHGAKVISDSEEIPKWIRDSTNVKPAVYPAFTTYDLFSIPGCRPFLWQHMVRKALFSEPVLRMNELLEIGEDQVFEIGYFMRAEKVRFIPDKLYSYRYHRAGSIMNKYDSKPVKKLEQHCIMLDSVWECTQNKVGKADETIVINWALDLTYWALYKVLHMVQFDYSPRIMVFLNNLHVNEHLDELDPLHLNMYAQIATMGSNVGDSEKALERLLELESEETERYKKVKKSIICRVLNRFFITNR